MQLIPVVDLKGGVVVRAHRGEREAYRPIETPLSSSAMPCDVVSGLLALAPFRTLYVADIDAITGVGTNDVALRDLRIRFPDIALWVDAGEGDPARIAARAKTGPGTPIVGTESLGEADVEAALAMDGVILSLDHDAAGPRGPEQAHRDARLWPARVIVMTLARVGSGEGPDMAALDRTARRAQAQGASPALYAAGGVRGPADLEVLARAGIAGALVASALHDGRIDRESARRWA